jgi:Ca2+-binding RTX toxin-like protein
MKSSVVIVAIAVCCWSGSASAQSAATCAFDAVTATVTVSVNGATANLRAVGSTGEIQLNGASCGQATVSNTDRVEVNGGALRDTVTVSGTFAPGLTAEADGSSEIEVLFALDGDDDTIRFNGAPGADRVFFTGGGIDVGHDGDQDITTSGTETLVVDGGAGNDIIDASAYSDSPALRRLRMFGGDGNDRLVGDGSGNRLYGDSGDDLLYGGDGPDLLYGGPGNDTMYGGPGTDHFFAESTLDGADVLHGGPGEDLASYAARSAAVHVTLGGDAADDGAAGEGDSIDLDVEDVTGGAGDDVLVGSGKRNRLNGGAGDDEVYGGAGDDVLDGGDGDDQVFGEDGDDGVFGENGADVLDGGDGADFLSGWAGNDLIFNADAFADTVDCGAALMDDAEPDPLDTFRNCEL